MEIAAGGVVNISQGMLNALGITTMIRGWNRNIGRIDNMDTLKAEELCVICRKIIHEDEGRFRFRSGTQCIECGENNWQEEAVKEGIQL